MSEPLKWKPRLISSSLPLEYEAARHLAERGFAVSADYAYARDDLGVTKDFSVDIHARGYAPFSDHNKIWATLDLLVECKQRGPNVSWLFLPDPNDSGFSPVTLGCTVRAFDAFSRWFLPSNATVGFDKGVQFCYKGVEVDEANGQVFDAELKHGVSQLQYALPRVVCDNALIGLNSLPDDDAPSFFCPILLTTARLVVARRTVTAQAVNDAKRVADLGRSVPFLVLFADNGPDFQAHRRRTCAPLANAAGNPVAREIDEHRRQNGEYGFRAPLYLAKELCSVEGPPHHDLFAQFVVCSLTNFPRLVGRIRRIVSVASKARMKTRPRKTLKPSVT